MSRFFVDADISRAKTLHTDFYNDPAVFELAKEKLFARSWQFIGDAGLVNEQVLPGPAYNFSTVTSFGGQLL